MHSHSPRQATRTQYHTSTKRDAPTPIDTLWHKWFLEQETNNTTRRTNWVLDPSLVRPSPSYQLNFKQWMDLSTDLIQLEAEMGRRKREERARRIAEMRQREKTKLIQEEIRQMESRIKQKQEAQHRLRVERDRLAYQERERRDDKKTMIAWQRYEENWKTILSPARELGFMDIPWPVIESPRGSEDIRMATVVQFLFSKLHSAGQSRKQRIRSAQLRWHPDRFQRVLNNVAHEDLEAVAEAAGSISRWLNTLMARESMIARDRKD